MWFCGDKGGDGFVRNIRLSTSRALKAKDRGPFSRCVSEGNSIQEQPSDSTTGL
jgi:hypothetical protein